MTKEDILTLIHEDIDRAFLELGKVFQRTNLRYKSLCDEYIDRPRDFTLPIFSSRLKAFVGTYYPNEELKAKRKIEEINHFDLLCQIDFEPQFTHFKNARLKNRAAAVLLHGENDEKGNDLKWSYHQLLKLENLMDEPPICIDFSGNANWSFEDVRNALYEKFIGSDCKDPDPDPLIRDKLAKYLEASNLVVLIKYVKKTTDFEAFYSSFHSFFAYLYREIRRDNSIIFLLIDDNLSDFYDLMDDRFLWYNEKERELHSKKIFDCQAAKIIDLSPVDMLNAQIIQNWISKNLYHTDVGEKLSGYLGKCDCFLDERANRYHVIKKLYSLLHPENTKNLDQCLKY